MHLNAATVRNLEVFANETDNTPTGSLYWVLNQTSTAFGARLLRRWVSRPLAQAAPIRERHEAVAALAGPASAGFEPILALLPKLPDLERAITRIYYGKCSTADFV